MKKFIAGWGGKATASLSWGDNGTFRTPAADVQFPIKIEAPVRNALLVNENVLHASAPYVVGVASGQDSGSGTSGNGHYAPYPAGIQAGDLLVVAIAPRATAGLVAPTGWTTLNSGRAFVIAKVADAADALVGGVVVPPATNARNWQYITAAVRNWAGSIASDVSYVSGGASNDPSSRTISWGTAAETLSLEYFIDTNAGGALTIVAPTTHAKNTALVQGTEATTGEFISIAMGSANTIAASINPSTWTITGSPVTTDLVGVLIRGNVGNGLRVLTNYRVVQPATYSNAQAFYTQTVSVGVGGVTILPSAYADPDVFQTQSIRRTVRPNLHGSTSQVLNPTLKLTVKPGAFSNAQAFFTQSIRRTLRPALFSDSDAFYAGSIQRTVKPGLYSDGDTFFGPSVITGNTVAPAAFTNAQAFYSPRIRVTLKPGLYTDADTFHAPTISLNRLVNPALFSNAQVFQAPRILVTLKPAALASTTTVPSPAIRRGINPALFVNAPTFRTQTVQAPYAVQPAKHFNSQVFPVTRVIGPPTPYAGLSGLYTTGYLRYKIPKVKKQDVPRGFILPPPEGIPDAAKIQRVRAYPLRKGELKGRTVLVNQPPPGGQPAQTDALDLILAALLLGRPNDGA